ncbi:protein NUCLEAR FUSION DEFECTIVE 4-like [Iris pallida]|uniref:Protein NUCLEAR FUSION DEFECTIVE 4-like n=1 Tax=Iris pallida TaxID=29817 RepID=A0AAX6GQ65_IRIPA|nr:protein NUCLEAR FUSION DEFECTIVE 4-like [Iris pallida]
MTLLLITPLAIPLKMTFYPAHWKKVSAVDPSGSAEQESLVDQERTELLLLLSSSTTNLGSFQEADDDTDVNLLLAEGEGAVKPMKKRRPKRGEDFNFGQAIIKADFWLLFLVYFHGVGSGVSVLNNLAQIGIAVGDDDTTVLYCVSSASAILLAV